MNKVMYVFAEVVFVVMIVLLSSVPAGSSSEDEPQLVVTLKVRKVFPLLNLGWYLIRVDVINIGNESLHLGTTRPAGGFVVYNKSGTIVCYKPEIILESISDFLLRPYQRKILFWGIWTVNGWKGMTETHTICGFMFGYEYGGVRYPQINSSPVNIYPLARPD